MKKICFLAQFPPPIHGLSKAVDTVYNSYLSEKYEFIKINLTDNKKFIFNMVKLIFTKADLFYFTISQTKGGNIRDLIILKLLRLKRARCVVHLHGGYYRKLVDTLGSLQKKLNYKYIGDLAGAIVLGNSLKSIFRGMIDEDKMFVVPNCVDNQFLMNDNEYNAKLLNLNINKLNVLYLSNFIKEKGYRLVLELAKYTKDIGDNRFCFNFAGNFFDESEKEYFNSYIKNNKIENIVNYLGVVGGKDKLELLKKSNIFTLLTRYPNEGQPISILEAMGNGMVVVVTDHAGIADIVRDNVNGVMFKDNEENNIDLVYKKINKIINEQFVDIIENNRKSVKDNYIEKIYLDNLDNIFNKL